jgi:predicted metal-dependent hydrolase
VTLRTDPSNEQIVLVQPARATARYVLDFVASRRQWVATHLDKMPPRVVFADGVTLNLRGQPHTVRFRPHAKNGVWREDGQIFVSGRAEHGARRLKDWLKAQARAEIGGLARDMALQLDARPITYIGVRDTTSRWGSCSHTGRLSFSWRLILAPDHVLTYVIAHEVAHLKHMNHSAAFWRAVEQLLGWTTKEVASARHWLHRHGAALHRFG